MQGRNFRHISQEERIRIEVLLQQGSSFSKIAWLLKRSVSTISREFSRNSSCCGKGPGYYLSRLAHQKAMRRHRLKPKRIHFDDDMKYSIVKGLTNERLSPELICVLGRRQRRDFISHEWIYQWIWRMKFSMCKKDRKWNHLYQYLKHGKRRKRRGNQHTKRGNILERVWIDQRPTLANDRKRTGDLEADIVLGINRRPGLLVALDRKSRKTWIQKLESKEARHVLGKLKKICNSTPFPVKTITLDNDLAFAEHYRLKEELGIQTYFTHPYSSQEKGSVENRIGLIRMFFDKKTDFTFVSNFEVKEVEKKINNRPLKMFNYKTPEEAYK